MGLFSKDYAKEAIVKNNVVLLYLYIIASPLSKLFVKLRVTPNVITIGSIIFAILAFIALIVDDSYIYFTVFWALSLYLDFCDGTVARMTGRINKTAFRFDHMSDIFKISIVLIGAGIHYNTFIIWLLSIAATFVFLYTMILNHDIGAYKKLKSVIDEQNSVSNRNVEEKKVGLGSKIKKSVIILNLYNFFATMNGHTLLLFFLIPLGIIQTKIFFVYFMFLAFIRSIKVISNLVNLPKIKTAN
ncbi:MAG: CDP-alcohol phosphatidyltransferase family protein [Salinivirgaceae bacterium]|jgi:hypothetical protein|nr:CDP-alcohol phosphatidyltransferase family protein [Salinivirgaceae bacterium]